MQKLFSKKLVLTTVIFMVASGIAISALALSQRHREAPPTASSKDPRTLQEKATRGGGKVVANLDFNKGAQKTSLASLVASSQSIVIATTDSNVSKLSEDGKVVRTFYRARVEQVLKGAVQPGGDITVSLPGGKVGFPGGGTAEVQTLWFKKMVNHKRYLLFLNGKPNAQTFTTNGGPQGVFEIPADGSGVLSHSGLTNDVMRQYGGKSIQSFVTEIKQAIGGQPNQ
jgi:hypothetical protein